MQTRTLGKTGLEVSRVGLGGLFVSKHSNEYEDGRAVIHRALDLGVSLIDTAPTYANSEEVLGRALEGVDKPYILSTKLGRPKPFDPKNAAHLRDSVKESLRLLKRDHIDILFIHEPERPRQYDWWHSLDEADGPVMEVLDELKKAGVIRFTGLGGTTAYEMARLIRTGRFDVLLTAFNYSLLWREAEREVLPAAVEQGMGILLGSPLQQGALAMRYDEQVESGAPWLSKPRRDQFRELYAYLDEIEMPIVELAMRFVFSNPHITTVLSGSKSIPEIEENVSYSEKGPLPPEIMKRLDEIAAMVPFRPYEEPFGLPFRHNNYKGPAIAGR